MITSIRRSVLTGLLSLAAMFAGSAQSAHAQNPPPNSPFVKVHQGKFYVNGQPYGFGSTNAYYLYQYENFNPAACTANLDFFQTSGVGVLRTWAFYDGSDIYPPNPNELPLQPSAGVYDETAFKRLDSMVFKAKNRNLKLIMTLVNFWHELGGVAQYVKWAGFTGAQGGSPGNAEAMYFYTNTSARTLFKNYITKMLNRVNTLTGVAYKDEPAIFAWELMNEGRLPGTTDTTAMFNWYQEMARHIKSIDSNHMVDTGEDGLEENMDVAGSPYRRTLSNTFYLRAWSGTSFSRNCTIPELDFASIHLYPDGYGFATSAWIPDSVTYVEDHARVAATYSKPLLVGEYGSGYIEGWNADSNWKKQFYGALWTTFEKEPNIVGDLIWQFVAGNVFPSKTGESGGNISSTRDPVLSSLLLQHHVKMQAKAGTVPPPTGDTTAPVIAIASPTTAATYTATATPITLAGSASDNVAVTTVTYTNAANGAAGTAGGTTAWSASVALAAGSNLITITARDAAGNTATDSITVTYTAPPPTGDTTAPAIAIASPTSASTYTAAATPFTLGGSASDNVAVTSVTYSNAANGASGTAGGTTSWSASLALVSGVNLITVTARDAAGNSTTDSITVTYAAVVQGGGSPDGGKSRRKCGSIGLDLMLLPAMVWLIRRRRHA